MTTPKPVILAPEALSPPATDNLAAAQAFAKAHPEIKWFDALFVDICGRVRGKRYPAADLEKVFSSGLQIPYTVYLLDVTGAMSDPLGRGFEDGDPDGHAMPVAGTLAKAMWTPDRAQALMSLMHADGRPTLVEPRNILRLVAEHFKAMGLRPVVALELEFYLIDIERGQDRSPRIAGDTLTGDRPVVGNVYEIRELDRYGKIMERIEEAALAQGIPASAATSEFAPGQFEINLHHTDDPARAADYAALLRHTIVSVARASGMDATFLSKPFAGFAGSGMHIHLSLINGDGQNIFDNGTREGALELRHAIGGLAMTMGEGMAYFASNLNAYRRFVPNLFVPMNRAWGINNRSTGLRVPAGDTAAKRVEHRLAGADANPYLALAAVLAGAHYGLVNKVDPGPAHTGNASATVDETLPFTLESALDQLEEAQVLPKYLTSDYCALYVATKRGELETFKATISPQEYNWYL